MSVRACKLRRSACMEAAAVASALPMLPVVKRLLEGYALRGWPVAPANVLNIDLE